MGLSAHRRYGVGIALWLMVLMIAMSLVSMERTDDTIMVRRRRKESVETISGGVATTIAKPTASLRSRSILSAAYRSADWRPMETLLQQYLYMEYLRICTCLVGSPPVASWAPSVCRQTTLSSFACPSCLTMHRGALSISARRP